MSAAVLHASAVAFGPAGGVLIEGPSGSGKSTLALALIAAGADLVADDRTLVFAQGGALYARAPRTIAGLIELRGLGLLRRAARGLARLRLVVTLGAPDAPRLPAPATCRRSGIEVAHLVVAGHGGPGLARGLAALIARPDPDRAAL